MSSTDIYTTKNRFCVYAHYRNDTNQLFYIGNGTIARSRHSSGRSAAWKAVVADAKGFTVKILYENLDKSSALEFETKLIVENLQNIVNTKIDDKQNILDFGVMSSLFYYDETSPSGIRWKENRYSGKGYCRVSAKQDDIAGFIHVCKTTSKELWKVKHNKKSVPVHRIIWVLLHKTIPEHMVIDHKDNNPLNNKIENLRCVDQFINTRNKSMSVSNTTGKVGVKFRSMYDGKYNYFIAQYHDNGKMINKIFSIDKLGNNEAFNQACEWRNTAMTKLNASGAGYTQNHC